MNDNTFVLDPVQARKRESALAPKHEPQPVLTSVGTSTTDAIKESIVLSPEVLRERYNVKLSSPHFNAWFLGKSVAPFGGSTLAINRLIRRSADGPIITELGGAIAARTKPIEMLQLIKAQRQGPKGKPGPLLTNGYANIFYWEDQIRLPEDEQVDYTNEAGEKVVLRAVNASYHSSVDGWLLDADSVLFPDAWVDGRQVFFRSSRLPSTT